MPGKQKKWCGLGAPNMVAQPFRSGVYAQPEGRRKGRRDDHGVIVGIGRDPEMYPELRS